MTNSSINSYVTHVFRFCLVFANVRDAESSSLLSFPRVRKLSRDVPADAGFLCDKATVFGEGIKGTPCVMNCRFLDVAMEGHCSYVC